MRQTGKVRCGAAIVAVALAVVMIAGCGSSSKSKSTKSSSGGSSSGSSAPKGKPIRIGVIAAGSGTFAYPWVAQAAEVGANAVNAAGGINGSPIRVDYCDDQSSPQTAALCAQKLLVTNHDLMLVGDDGIFDAGVTPLLKSTHTILFGTEGASVADYGSPNVFMTDPEIADFDVIPQVLPPGKQNVVDFVGDNAVAVKAAQLNEPLYTKRGYKFKVVTVPVAASNFSTPCLQGKSTGANIAVVEFAGQTQFGPMAQACKQIGYTPEWVLNGSVLSSGVLASAHKLGLKTLVVMPFTSKTYSSLIANSAKYGPKLTEPYQDSASNAYVGMMLLPSLIKGAGAANGAKIKSWLSTQTSFNMQGFAPPINFSSSFKPFGSTLPGLKNLCVYTYRQQDTKLIQSSSKPICFKP